MLEAGLWRLQRRNATEKKHRILLVNVIHQQARFSIFCDYNNLKYIRSTSILYICRPTAVTTHPCSKQIFFFFQTHFHSLPSFLCRNRYICILINKSVYKGWKMAIIYSFLQMHLFKAVSYSNLTRGKGTTFLLKIEIGQLFRCFRFCSAISNNVLFSEMEPEQTKSGCRVTVVISEGILRGVQVIEVELGWSSKVAGVENGAAATSSCISYKCILKMYETGTTFVWLVPLMSSSMSWFALDSLLAVK